VAKIKEINDNGKPYYGTVITLTNHTPFSDTDKYGEFDVDLKETVKNPTTGQMEEVSYPYMEGTKLGNYFKSVHYADKQLGMFINMLEEEGIMDNTVLVLYGDHDARLPKSDYRRLYNYDKETDSTISCTEENEDECVVVDKNTYELIRKVPFIIYSKETKEKLHKEVTDVMGMYDCMPTLGNMFGFYNKYALGHDIFDIKDENIVVFPNGNWVTNKIYYNSQNNTWLPLTTSELPLDYIEKNTEYTEKLLSASNATIVYDLIKKTRQVQESKTDYLEEKTIDQYEK
jgi:phosphoglycerol transferase MdoB-like AlkP superfamily enzyme